MLQVPVTGDKIITHNMNLLASLSVCLKRIDLMPRRLNEGELMKERVIMKCYAQITGNTFCYY